MRKFFWLLAVTVLAWPVMAGAMQEDDDGAESAAEEAAAEEEEDVIIVYGEGRRDPGMAAFMAGDYEQAEIEFELNLECAERERMMQETFLEMRGPNGEPLFYPSPRSKTSTGADGYDRTCENSAWQLYMIAMSQLQQGKYDEAKRNFYRVINITRDPLLYDAHYRIALLEILDGNLDEAEDRLQTLIVRQERCHRLEGRCEYLVEIDEAVAYLEQALANARAEATAG